MHLNKSTRTVFAVFLAMFVTTAFAADAIAMPELDLSGPLKTISTWVIGLMGAVFLGKMSVPLAAWGFRKVMGFLGR